MSRSTQPVEWGKFGRLGPVAAFLHLPLQDVRALRNLGLIPLRHGRITPEDLRDAWKAHAWRLDAGAAVPTHPFTLLRDTAPRVPARRAGQPLVYRLDGETLAKRGLV